MKSKNFSNKKSSRLDKINFLRAQYEMSLLTQPIYYCENLLITFSSPWESGHKI